MVGLGAVGGVSVFKHVEHQLHLIPVVFFQLGSAGNLEFHHGDDAGAAVFLGVEHLQALAFVLAAMGFGDVFKVTCIGSPVLADIGVFQYREDSVC